MGIHVPGLSWLLFRLHTQPPSEGQAHPFAGTDTYKKEVKKEDLYKRRLCGWKPEEGSTAMPWTRPSNLPGMSQVYCVQPSNRLFPLSAAAHFVWKPHSSTVEAHNRMRLQCSKASRTWPPWHEPSQHNQHKQHLRDCGHAHMDMHIHLRGKTHLTFSAAGKQSGTHKARFDYR